MMYFFFPEVLPPSQCSCLQSHRPELYQSACLSELLERVTFPDLVSFTLSLKLPTVLCDSHVAGLHAGLMPGLSLFLFCLLPPGPCWNLQLVCFGVGLLNANKVALELPFESVLKFFYEQYKEGTLMSLLRGPLWASFLFVILLIHHKLRHL